jgi:adenylate kinase family enzyme
MNQDHFDLLIIIGRPAAGKSEVIDFLKKTPLAERLQRFHISNFEEFDDFVYVWETFETDDILSRHSKPRLWTDERYWFKDDFIWNLYIERINLSYRKKLAAQPNYHDSATALIEFARGGESGFREAFSYLHEEILRRAGILYIKVSYEESVRKNRRRARPGMEDSILYHSLPDEKMDFYYKTNDWETLTAGDRDFITIKGFKVPYAVFENQPEKTDDPLTLGRELERVTARLWKLRGTGH